MGYKTLVNFFRKNTMKQYITSAITKVGIYTGMASSVASFITTLLNFNIGGAITYALDRYDKRILMGGFNFK